MGKRKLLAAAFAGAMAMMVSSAADAAHQFQLKNCDPYADMWDYWVYNADDDVEFQPFMTLSFSAVGQIKTGKCKGEGEGYCKVTNANVQRYKFHVQTAKTVYGDAGYLRTYDGLLDCSNEPAH